MFKIWHARRRGQLLGEFEQRQGDPMPGGGDGRRGMMTAYRHKPLFLDPVRLPA